MKIGAVFVVAAAVIGYITAKPQGISCSPTPEATEGPYFLVDAPFRNDTLCVTSPANERLRLSGQVFGSDCNTGVESRLEVWQADVKGVYSNGYGGYECRATLHTDKDGRYSFTTEFPGRYLIGPGYRPAHIHFKVSPKNRQYRQLTTQLYFTLDEFLGKNDECSIEECHSDEPQLTVTVNYASDVKTREAVWNINLAKCD